MHQELNCNNHDDFLSTMEHQVFYIGSCIYVLKTFTFKVCFNTLDYNPIGYLFCRWYLRRCQVVVYRVLSWVALTDRQEKKYLLPLVLRSEDIIKKENSFWGLIQT